MRKVLAIDYGTVRVGLAINQHDLAEPFEILTNGPELIEELKEILEDQQIQLILVGMSENKMAERTEQFIAQLQAEIDLPIEIVDETLSSQEVHERLKESHLKLSKRQGPIDHYAAAVILQDWLDFN